MNCGACKRECRTTRMAHVTKGVNEVEVQRRDASEVVSAAAKKLRDMAGAYDAAAGTTPDDQGKHAAGRAAGLEQAADILEAGDY